MVEVTGKGRRIGGDVRKCMAGIKCKLHISEKDTVDGQTHFPRFF